MKKYLIALLIVIIMPSFVFAYSYSVTDENGNIILDESCETSSVGNYYLCEDKVSGKTYHRDRHEHTTKKIYVNGEYKTIQIDKVGDRTYIRY